MITKMTELGTQTEKIKLTDRQMEIYVYIRNRSACGRPAPTVRELCNEFGVNSPNGIRYHILELEQKGWIKRDEYSARSITIVSQPRSEVVLLIPGQTINVDGVMIECLTNTEDGVRVEVGFRDHQEFSIDG